MDAPKPGSPEWLALVTASKVAPILGLSPYASPFKVWHQMKGLIPGDPENDAMRRGNMLEDAILNWWLTDNPDATEKARQEWCPFEDWAGATPDLTVISATGELELIDAKTAAYDDEWGIPGTDQVPAYYAASSMWQLAVRHEAARVRLAVLFGRPFTLREYVIERDDALCGALIDQCRAFYDTLAADVAPDLDDTVATYDTMRALHPEIDRDDVADLTPDERDEYLAASAALEDAEARDRLAKSVVLQRMGRARLAKCDGQTIARRQPHFRNGVSLVRVAPNRPATESEPAA